MKTRLKRLEKYIPKYCYQTIFDIPYIKLYESGKRVILIDIDNTMISYDLVYPTDEVIKLIDEVKKIGFKVIIVSNNSKIRVAKVASRLDVGFAYRAMKPFLKGFRKAYKLVSNKKEEVISVGDQLMTDVKGSNRFGVDAILVHCIKRASEKWYTKLNRKRENNILKMIKDNYPLEFEKIIKVRGLENEN